MSNKYDLYLQILFSILIMLVVYWQFRYTFLAKSIIKKLSEKDSLEFKKRKVAPYDQRLIEEILTRNNSSGFKKFKRTRLISKGLLYLAGVSLLIWTSIK